MNISKFKVIFILILALGLGSTVLASAYSYTYGAGTSGDPYQIWDLEDLDGMRDSMGDDVTYKLMRNLDFDLDASYDNPGANKAGWTTGSGWDPIGEIPYSGTPWLADFDGNDFNISNLYMDHTSGTNNHGHLGLFGWIHGESQSGDPTIQDLGLIDVDITYDADDGTDCIGALAGAISGGNAGITNIRNIYASGTINGFDDCGGIIGKAKQLQMNDCWSDVDVNGEDQVGGLIGRLSMGSGYGGQSETAEIYRSYATGDIDGDNQVGGIIGFTGSCNSNNRIYGVAYWGGTVTGNTNVGGLIGDVSDTDFSESRSLWDMGTSGQATTSENKGTGYSTADMKDPDTYDGEDWGYLVLDDTLRVFASGAGTSGDPYLITKIEHLNSSRMAHFGIDTGSSYIYYWPEDYVYYQLVNDLDFSDNGDYLDYVLNKPQFTQPGGRGWIPLSDFKGHFDGNGKTISGLWVNDPDIRSYSGAGLIGEIINAEIYDLGLLGVNITATSSAYYQGALVGMIYNGSITNVYASGLVYGDGFTGGLIGGSGTGGASDGIVDIDSCFAYVNVYNDYYNTGGFTGSINDGTTVTNCYARGDVYTSGWGTEGGFAGGELGDGIIEDCYSTGRVYNWTSSSFQTDKGFAGDGFQTQTGCFWDTQVSLASTTQCSANGRTTAQMKDYDTFNDDGWDIAEIGSWTSETWFITDGYDYPRLGYEVDIDWFGLTSSLGNAGGDISPLGLTEVMGGATLRYDIEADPGYHISDVIVDEVSVGDVAWVEFSGISANHTIEAWFGGSLSYYANLRRYENGSLVAGAYNASIVEEDSTVSTELISADSTLLTVDTAIWAFTYPLPGGGFRTLYNPSSPITPIVPNDVDESDTYQFYIKDLTGYLNGKTAILEAWRNVNGSDTVIESGAFNNPINGVPLTLSRFTIVRLKLLFEDGVTRYDFGDFMPTGDPLSHTLVFNYMDFDQTINFVTAYVSASATRSLNFTNIDLEHLNNLTDGYSFSASYQVKTRDGSLIDSWGSSSDSDSHGFSGLTPATAYFLFAEFEHDYWDGLTIKKAWTFPGETSFNLTAFPDLEDLGYTFGGVTEVIPVGILLMVAGLFSYVSAPIGIIFTVLVAGAMADIGILSVSSTALGLALSLGIIMAVGRRKL